MLSWVNLLGTGYSGGATGCPILITEDGVDYIITYAATTVAKVETVTGTVVARGAMDRPSAFAINSPTYAEGMIFIALLNGGVQAFDAGTLNSLWIYNDELGGQPNCPITYRDGYIYTGFWSGETKSANYVCLSVTDEDPSSPLESKIAGWTYSSNGGFYWAGSYIGEDFLLVGTDDGSPGYESNTSALLCLDTKSGALLDKIDGLCGDIRSNVSYANGRYFFTSKGGYFYSAEVVRDENGTARLKHSSFRQIRLSNYSDGTNAAMSTSTPVVYGSRAYIGVSGISQFGAYSGHNITVIDLNTWTIAYSVRTQGYPQTSGLLTTAYEQEDGYVYVYFFDNYTPGKLRMLKDKPGVKSALLVDEERYTEKGLVTVYNTARVIFTPRREQAQYAICSPISDSYGNIFFKNDSAFMMAVGKRIEDMEVTKLPDRTEYDIGDVFEPDGMEITITYTDGTQRTLPWGRVINGITINYFTWSTSPLNENSTVLTITHPYVRYGDRSVTR